MSATDPAYDKASDHQEDADEKPGVTDFSGDVDAGISHAQHPTIDRDPVAQI